ncbi:MAG: hypothetical protein K0Q79_909 [Flavipsychrobacter sp.]|nr:hypothetical protein [Flavipsychrobacter sp.]
MGERAYELRLVHIPTNIEVSEQIIGTYDRKEWTKVRNMLYAKLFSELENKVAKALRISGRS